MLNLLLFLIRSAIEIFFQFKAFLMLPLSFQGK